MQVREPAILVRTPAGSIIGWSEQAEQLFGYTTHEVVGQSIDLLMVPAEASAQEVLAERICLTKDGRALSVLCRRTPISDGSDRTLAISELLTVTDELDASGVHSPELDSVRVARARLEQQQGEHARLKRAVECSPGVTLSFRIGADGDMKFALVSSAALQLYGFTPEQIERDASLITSRIPAEDLASGQQLHASSAERGGPMRTEFRYLHPSGATKWLEARSLPSEQPDGSVVWNGVVIDVTERKQAEEKLAITQTQLESALEAGELGAWQWDIASGLVWGNVDLRNLWEVAASAPEWFDCERARATLHPDDRERVLAELEQTRGRELHEGRSETEFRIVRSDGSLRWITSRARVEESPDGKGRRVFGVHVDVTRQKLAAESALRLHKLEALGTLAGGIAHDFNNILFSISGNAALALGTVPIDSPARRFVKEIAAAAARATDLVRQILVFSRPEEQECKLMEIGTAVQDALTLVRATTPARIEVVSSIDPSTPEIVADSSRLVQIVVNLCANAVQAIGKNQAGRVEVRVAPYVVVRAAQGPGSLALGSYARLSVRDDGCGIDESTRARMFDPFFTTKPPGEGSGLGLSVVHGIVTALGGHVEVSSKPGAGTTFDLYFPAAPEDEVEEEVDSRRQGHGERILFVDDESMLVQLGESMLEVLGYRGIAFQHASAALDAFRSAPDSFSAVITDLSMPAMSGFELARALLAIRPDLPILVMSGYVGPEERATAAKLGIRELVLKPVTMERLAELLLRLC